MDASRPSGAESSLFLFEGIDGKPRAMALGAVCRMFNNGGVSWPDIPKLPAGCAGVKI